MKYIFFQLCIACIVLTTQAQETGRSQLPPMRTSDPARPRQIVTQAVLPLKSGGNAARQQMSVQPAEAPVRKTDAPVAVSAGDRTKSKVTSKDKPAITLPSSLSIKEAKEQSKQ